MPISWMRGTPYSGLVFPLVTASGTYATSLVGLSSQVSKDGGAWAATDQQISALGWGYVGNFIGTELDAYTTTVMVTHATGCLPQSIIFVMQSGLATAVSVSGLANKGNISGLPGIASCLSGLALSSLALTHQYSVSGLATLDSVSGVPAILAQTSGIALSSLVHTIPTNVSGLATLTSVSGLAKLDSVSGIPGIMTQVSGIARSGLSYALRTDTSGLATHMDVSSVPWMAKMALNRATFVDATGLMALYERDGVTVAASGQVQDNSTLTDRAMVNWG